MCVSHGEERNKGVCSCHFEARQGALWPSRGQRWHRRETPTRRPQRRPAGQHSGARPGAVRSGFLAAPCPCVPRSLRSLPTHAARARGPAGVSRPPRPASGASLLLTWPLPATRLLPSPSEAGQRARHRWVFSHAPCRCSTLWLDLNPVIYLDYTKSDII